MKMAEMPKKLSTGHIVEKINDEDTERIRKHFPGYTDIVRLQPGGWFFVECFPSLAERIYKFDFKPTDVIVMGYPKSGTSWIQEIVWTYLFNTNLDNPAAKQMLEIRSPGIEFDIFLKGKSASENAPVNALTFAKTFIEKMNPERVDDEDTSFTITELMPSPRVIKTHLSFSIFPPTLHNSKVIYIARDPRDVIISRYSWFQLMKYHNFTGSMDDFLDYFLAEEMLFNPFWLLMKEAWDLRHHPNVLFLHYEDMKTDPIIEMMKIDHFVGTKLSDEQIKNIAEFTSFSKMKKSSDVSVNHPMSAGGAMFNKDILEKTGGYYRSGKAGDWTQKFTPQQVERINKWIEERTKDYPEDFPYLQ